MIYVFTLGYNLVSEIAKTTKLLYEQNDRKDFHHIIVDLGFPMVEAGKIPDDFGVAKFNNTIALMQLSQMYGSEYLALPNIGVSQNWTAVCRHINPQDDDILIGADPDERPMNEGWMKAMSDVLLSGNNGMVTLMCPGQPEVARKVSQSVKIQGHEVLFPKTRNYCWALIGITGKFFRALGEMPYPTGALRYGWIETVLYPKFHQLGFSWCALPEYLVNHTVWDGPSLLQDWKYYITSNLKGGQLSFEDYLTMKKEGKL